MRIGTSGWSYRHWKGTFYPADLPQRAWLAYYAQHFDTVEVNATFYRLQSEATVARWAAEAPNGFLFAVKLSRYITHVRRLSEPEQPLAVFTGSLAPLDGHLGPVLAQLPGRKPVDPELLDRFLAACGKLRIAVEFRDPHWFRPEIETVLRERHVPLVWSDYPGAETPEWETGPFVYVRRHGHDVRYGGSYPDDVLERLAERLSAVDRDMFCYFNNDAGGAAPKDAARLRAMVG